MWLISVLCGIFAIMIDLSHSDNQIHFVSNFHDLVSKPFRGGINAICWNRALIGNFSEIVNKIKLDGNITTVDEEDLRDLTLSEEGKLARAMLLSDWKLLEDHGASPTLNVIKAYERDDANTFFPTDVYSFHVDRAPISADTFLCTYFGTTSEILPNAQGEKKVLIPEIRDGLKKQYLGADQDFESYLSENFFDLHYQAKADARPISLGLGHLCRLAIDHPESQVLPCLHRAPMERLGEYRLLLIC